MTVLDAFRPDRPRASPAASARAAATAAPRTKRAPDGRPASTADDGADRPGARPRRSNGLRIGHSVLLVGAIPIVAAAAIAVAALLLLGEADRARSGAVLAGSVYRNAIAASVVRDAYLGAPAHRRRPHVQDFFAATRAVGDDLGALEAVVRAPEHAAAIAGARVALRSMTALMARLVAITERNDESVARMTARAEFLVRLSDEARRRQQVSNTNLVTSLGATDTRLRHARAVVDEANMLRAILSDLERLRLEGTAGEVAPQRIHLYETRLSRTAAALGDALAEDGPTGDRRTLDALVRAYLAAARQPSGADPAARGAAAGELLDWTDRLIKTNRTEGNALHQRLAELLIYSVEASETDQATQNIATEMLKLAEQTTRALVGRDLGGIDAALETSREVSARIAALPISPLIQTEMLDASTAWREALSATSSELTLQNGLVEDMTLAAGTLIDQVSRLNDVLIRHAEEIGHLVRNLLVGAAAFGLVLAGALGLAVARSITRPLHRLQQEMLALAGGTHSGAIAGTQRRDELGDMARVTEHFLTELKRREGELVRANEAAQQALADLRRTQADLIQAEKLASLGQLVAGVAHEINTPLGVALTTSTVIGPEAERFAETAESGRLSRTALREFAARMTEGTRLLTSNLERATQLVQSFKQVAVDQASGERRTFRTGIWLDDLLTSLGPVLRKAGHTVDVACAQDVELDSYPGALAQVLTNLIVNAVSHAYGPNERGRLAVSIAETVPGTVRIEFADDGRGIPPEHLPRVFDPFFTTGRSTGSTGLGLHIVYNLVTGRLGGRIDLRSEVGRGTRFIIDLPRCAPQE